MQRDPSVSIPESTSVAQTIVERPPGAARPASLLDQVLEQAAEPSAGLLERFQREPSLARQVELWLGRLPRSRGEWDQWLAAIGRDVARLDRLLEDQVNAILHHPRFQRLESAWRGLWYLTGQAEQAREQLDHAREQGEVQVRILNVSKRELHRDFQKAIEFDQSALFKKVYEEEFGTAGGEPFGMLVADYEFNNHPDDIELLERLVDVAAAAFSPLIAGAEPSMFGIDDFSSLEQPLGLARTFEQLEYVKWRALRDREESRFLGLTGPRILMRRPYEDDGSQPQGFRFREQVEGPDRSQYLWGSASWAFASVAMRAYAQSGWFADIRGVQRGMLAGGLVTDLPSHSFATDALGVAVKSSVEVAVGDRQETELCQLGFIPLCHCHDTAYSAFFSNPSVHKPRQYDDPVATANARISSMLQYTLCASRFAHYLKVQARNRVGGLGGADELETFLNQWLSQYVTSDDKAPAETKARFPLRQGQTEVSEIPGQPGNYRLKIHLLPHYQLDQLTASVRLTARVVEPGGSAG